jgi:hypothetical protein
LFNKSVVQIWRTVVEKSLTEPSICATAWFGAKIWVGAKTMTKLDSFIARAHALARSGHFYGLPPLEFELSFEEGFHEAREWLKLAATREKLERLCQESSPGLAIWADDPNYAQG